MSSIIYLAVYLIGYILAFISWIKLIRKSCDITLGLLIFIFLVSTASWIIVFFDILANLNYVIIKKKENEEF